jgi:hypothetical protein
VVRVSVVVRKLVELYKKRQAERARDDALRTVTRLAKAFKATGGLCMFCENAERVELSGTVYCTVYGKVRVALRCKSYIQAL